MTAWPVRVRRLSLVLVIAAAAIAALALAGGGRGAGAAKQATPASLGATAYTAAVGPAPGKARLDLELPLVANDAGLARFAAAVSDPTSPRYRHFASARTLAQRFGAKPGVAAAVQRFLRRAGARNVALNPIGQFVTATMTVAAAQRTFATRLARFRDAHGQEYIAPASLVHAASAQPPLPGALRGRVTGVVGLDTEKLATTNMHAALTHGAGAPTSFAATGGARAAAHQLPSLLPRSGTAGGCKAARHTDSFTPNQYLTAYGYQALHKANLRGQGESAALIEIDGFRSSDITNFVRCFRLPVPRISVVPVGGLHHPLSPGGETTLDLEMLTVAAPRLRRIYVYESKGNAGHVLKAYSSALARSRHPQVISASLGLCEPLALATMGDSGINTIERILATAAGSGVSVVASAGDQGSSSCVLLGHILHRLAVSYPASSPFVTSVGGTNMIVGRSNQLRAELVWNDTYVIHDAGGGGVSTEFHAPAYQAALHSKWRTLPDVSMLADLAPGYAIYCTAKDPQCGRGGWTGAGGTSAAAPLFAGAIALIDQDLRLHKRHALGNLNPVLYYVGSSAARPLVFNDVTAINNDLGPYLAGGHRKALGCCGAEPGYDAASGWGSVNVAGLAHILVP